VITAEVGCRRLDDRQIRREQGATEAAGALPRLHGG
jgi:hypothetical protein